MEIFDFFYVPCTLNARQWFYLSYSHWIFCVFLKYANKQIWRCSLTWQTSHPRKGDSSLSLSFFFFFFTNSVLSDSLWPHESQHPRPPCPSPAPRIYPNSCPLSWWCHPTISSSVIPFSSCPQSFPASGSFQMSQLFTSGGQSNGVSASTSVLPMNTQAWTPLGWTGWISRQS